MLDRSLFTFVVSIINYFRLTLKCTGVGRTLGALKRAATARLTASGPVRLSVSMENRYRTVQAAPRNGKTDTELCLKTGKQIQNCA